MDAVPISLGQVFSGYVSQINQGIKALDESLPGLAELALGGTAVGTGLNTPQGFDLDAVSLIAKLTGLPFKPAKNKFAAISCHDAIVQTHSAIKQFTSSIMKITNDIRILSSGPRAGLNELKLPTNEPGSSIMPGKVNPTQIEALTMVCTQIIGNDVTITLANGSGYFELNVFKPVIIANMLESSSLLADACNSFNKNCLFDLKPNRDKIDEQLENSLMLVTALVPHIGYEKAGIIAQKAFDEGISLKEASTKFGLADEFDKWIIPEKMIQPLTD
jgi:fumarate hydratase class II